MGERIASHRGRTAVPESTRYAPARFRRGLWTGLGIGAGTAALLLSILVHRVPYFPSDVRITRTIQATDMRVLAVPLHALNAVGFPPLVDIVYGGIIIVLLAFGRKWEAVSGSFDALGSAGMNAVVKLLVDRPRPSSQLVHVEHHIANPSYPAGHVLNFTAFVGFLCWLVYLRMRPSVGRNSLIAVLVTLIGLMGLARVDSGEHWPSDVLGGYLLGALWLAVTVLFYDGGGHRLPGPPARAAASAGHRGVLLFLMLLSPTALVGSAAAAPPDADSLAASTEVPWNPPHALSRRTGWERVALLPGQIVSLPLSGLGYVLDQALFHLEQNPRFANGLIPSPGSGSRLFVLRPAKLGDRTSLGGAMEVRKDVFPGALQSRISAEYAGTLHRYNRTLVTWSGRPASVQYGYEWRPQDRFYGVGQDTRVDSVSDYASQREFVRGGLTWASNRERDRTRPTSAISLWAGPRSQVTRTGRETGAVPIERRFPALAAATLDRRVENLVYGASLLHDWRVGSPHWSRGGRMLVSAERFDVPSRALALHSGIADGAQFTRVEAEAEAGVSFMRDPRTLRLRVRVTDQQVSSNRDRLLVSDLSTLGGQAGLGGFSPGRFHDLDLLLTRLDYVFPLERRLEVDLHSEWGGVYPDLWSDAKLNTLHHSFGFSLRVRDDHKPRGSIGLDFSREAVRFLFSLGGES